MTRTASSISSPEDSAATHCTTMTAMEHSASRPLDATQIPRHPMHVGGLRSRPPPTHYASRFVHWPRSGVTSTATGASSHLAPLTFGRCLLPAACCAAACCAAALLSPNGGGLGLPCAARSRLDLFVANENSPHLLYRNLGHGHFVQVSGSFNAGIFAGSDKLALFDADNDGDLDLLLGYSLHLYTHCPGEAHYGRSQACTSIPTYARRGAFSDQAFECSPNSVRSVVATQCITCAPGFTRELGASACSKCASGTAQLNGDATDCVECTPGTHSPINGSVLCFGARSEIALDLKIGPPSALTRCSCPPLDPPR